MTLVESISGIRGIYNIELTKEIILKYVLSFKELLTLRNKKKIKIIIGRDSRPSGKEISNFIIKNLDCTIIDVGLLSTPAIENAVREFNADGGIIITASHNEPEYNGFKFLTKTGAVFDSKNMNILIQANKRLKNTQIKQKSYNKSIKANKQAFELYKKFIKNILKTKLEFNEKIIIDPNGGSGIISKPILDDYKINTLYLNMEEGRFNRLIEPTELSLRNLQKIIIKNNANFAAGFDCDADRIEIILKNGKFISGNHILALIVKEILSNLNINKTKQKPVIVVNNATSYLVKEIAEKYNAKFIEVDVGEINVVKEMIKNNAVIGGEGSNGGVIIPPSKCRDGILTLLYLLKIMKKERKTLKQLISELPVYYYIKHKIKIKNDFNNIKQKVKQAYLKKGFKLKPIKDLEGLKFTRADSWILFRQSKTEDKVLRIIIDSKNQKITENLLKEAKTILQ